MKERILELAEQAGASVSTIGGIFINKTNLDIEKFAELIVRECIEINKQELAFNAFERLLNRYQEHFGVK
jgi:hypothetical protein